MITLSILCLVAVAVIGVVLALFSVPFLLIMGILPWALRIAGVVLLVKAILDRPSRWENFLPAVGAFALSWLIGFIF